MMDDTAAGRITSDSTSAEEYSTSAAKMAPARGALNMLPIPAPMPAANSQRLVRTSNPNRMDRKLPKPAPICAMGPSLPPDPPDPMVMMEANNFTMGTAGRMTPRLW